MVDNLERLRKNRNEMLSHLFDGFVLKEIDGESWYCIEGGKVSISFLDEGRVVSVKSGKRLLSVNLQRRFNKLFEKAECELMYLNDRLILAKHPFSELPFILQNEDFEIQYIGDNEKLILQKKGDQRHAVSITLDYENRVYELMNTKYYPATKGGRILGEECKEKNAEKLVYGSVSEKIGLNEFETYIQSISSRIDGMKICEEEIKTFFERKKKFSREYKLGGMVSSNDYVIYFRMDTAYRDAISYITVRRIDRKKLSGLIQYFPANRMDIESLVRRVYEEHERCRKSDRYCDRLH